MCVCELYQIFNDTINLLYYMYENFFKGCFVLCSYNINGTYDLLENFYLRLMATFINHIIITNIKAAITAANNTLAVST